ncbi:hypothetical protein [Halobacteriovorax sp. HLS]|uniref:hypothetical protein n=1 Tax=Halobacteriovorax sp. HLS TaxID=2234000 RepID=UPI000FD7645D|nr:hypothetical protein [Halobacteriovorax sp. HLS]
MNEFFEASIDKKFDQKDLWKTCIKNARDTLHSRDLCDSELLKILDASNSPQKFNTIIRLIYVYSKTRPDGHTAVKLLFENTDTSIYSLAEWIDAIDHFDSWLADNNRKADWKMMLGYIACCSQSPENKDIKHNFIELIDEMLNTYGFDG